MRCSACQSENPAGKKFCGDCGAALENRCPQCGADNPANKRFCGDCGAPIVSLAGSGAAAPARAESSTTRAATAGSHAAAAETRKVITVIFADLMASTALQERLDPESVNRVMDAYYRAVRTPVEAAGGTVVQLLGDGVLCAFGIPRIAEDDALRAVRAAVGIQQAFREFLQAQPWLTVPIGLRVAVNTGEVVVSERHPAGIGDPLNVAARLQEEARDGEVLIGPATRRLVADAVTLERAGVFALKGRVETVTAYRVVSLERPAGVATAAFVGRDDELARITAVYEAARVKPAARLAVVLGSPGLGKSRLLAEVAHRVGDAASVVTAQCDAAGRATFAPVAEALRKHFGTHGEGESPDEPPSVDTRATTRSAGASPSPELRAIEATLPADVPDRARIAAGIGALLAGSPASPEETFFVIRRFLSALAQQKPVVLLIDDLHWAEPLLLDLVEHLIQWGSGVPLLVLVGARPELREVRSSLVTPGGLVSAVVTLSGLDAGAATRLAANVIGASDLPAVVAAKVLSTSEGNPLFVGELVRMLVDEGAIERQGDRWIVGANLAALEMPPTIHALLAARIERLRPEERTVLERAAVVGRHFSRSAVAALLGRNGGELDARLEALRRTELIERDAGWFLGEPALRFHHVLIRDAAYRRLLKGTRAELHERLADWIEARVGDAAEHDETIGWHLEQAHQLLSELGPLDTGRKALGDRAARRLAAAGRRALARDDLLPAASLLGRALNRLGTEDPSRADLALDWCEALLAAGDVAPAGDAIDKLGRLADREGEAPAEPGAAVAAMAQVSPNETARREPRPPTANTRRLSAWHACFSGQLAVLTDPKALRAAEASVAAAAETLTAAGDTRGEAKAHSVHALVLAQLGKIGACEAALDRALAAARRVRGERRLANAVLAGAPLAALWGPSPVTRASGRCLDVVRVLRITQGAPAVEAVALRCQAVLETLRGRGEAARRMIASSRKLVEELGITQRVLEADLFAGLIELLESDAPAAEHCLRSAWDGLRNEGLGIAAAQAGALLARALLAQRRIDEADEVSRESELLAGDSFQAAIAWRGVRAEVLAARGEHAAAIDLARAAVEIAAATDDLLDHADARASLAVALRAAGRETEADAEERRAVELWEAKGATLLVERARRASARTTAATAPEGPTAATQPQEVRRRVGRNAMTKCLDAVRAAFANRDLDELAAARAEEFFAEGFCVVHHATGTVLDLEACFDWWRAYLTDPDVIFEWEALATLGDSLGLLRLSWWGSASNDRVLAVGPFEGGELHVSEVDARGRVERVEVFARDRLGDAALHLYERYAALLPEGPERERAARVASTIGAYYGPLDADRFAATWAPDVEYIDRRRIGMGSTRGIAALRQIVESLIEAAPDTANRVDDILALRPDGWLRCTTSLGTDRTTGGAYERPQIMLTITGADGLVTRIEQFDPDREADALARFDELTTARPTIARRVRANAATAHHARLEAAIAAHDTEALPALLADDFEAVNHQHGATYDRKGPLLAWRGILRNQGRLAIETVATLGDSLGLSRQRWSSDQYADAILDVGAVVHDTVVLTEVNGRGQARHAEAFALDRLGDAIVRLYERYAALLPEGPERESAAATARSVASVVGPFNIDRYAAAFAPEIEAVDHRTLGSWSAHGADMLLNHFRSFLALVEGATMRADEVLALHASALLVRWTNLGTARTGGGAYERQFLMLAVYADDGLICRNEWFDPDREAEALARFDELTTLQPPIARRVRPNAVTRFLERASAAIRAGDFETLSALHAAGVRAVHYQAGIVLERTELLAWWRLFFGDRSAAFPAEPIAALGDSLMLYNQTWTGSGSADQRFDIGPWQQDALALAEVDAQDRAVWIEVFAKEQLATALMRLYERYAELLPEGPARTRGATIVRSIAVMTQAYDPDAFATGWAPDIEYADHRTAGVGPLAGIPAIQQWLRSLLDDAQDVANRMDEVLATSPEALLVRTTNTGTLRASRGAYERPFLLLMVFGSQGLVARMELFDPDRNAEALARFDELTTPRPTTARRVRPNAVTASGERLRAAALASDFDTIAALCADGLEVIHHPTGGRIDREGGLKRWRILTQAEGLRLSFETFATLGDSLGLGHDVTSFDRLEQDGLSFGASRSSYLNVMEVDARGRCTRVEVFADDRLGDAIVRLYERYAELLPAGPDRASAETVARVVARMTTASLGLDVERLPDGVVHDIEFADRRTLGFASAFGIDAFGRVLTAGRETARDVVDRVDEILDARPEALLLRVTNSGTDRATGGAFERCLLRLATFGADGRLTRVEQFDPNCTAEALARFDALTATRRSMRRVRGNAATAVAQARAAAFAARDLDAVDGLLADDYEAVYHPTGLVYDRSGSLATAQFVFATPVARLTHEPLATLGDSLALSRDVLLATGDAFGLGIGDSEVILFAINETGPDGKARRGEAFAADKLGDAIVRLYERHAQLLPAGPERERAAAIARSAAAFVGHFDLDRRARAFAADVECVDHRMLGTWSAKGRDAVLGNLRSLLELTHGVAVQYDDVLALRPDAFLVRVTVAGTDRAGGGAFERVYLGLCAFGADGLLTRWEQFDSDRETEALARFDALTTPRPVLIRRVQPNLALEVGARADAALTARDVDAFLSTFVEDAELVDHPTGGNYGLREIGLVWRRAFQRVPHHSFETEALATLGDRLLLARQTVRGGASSGGRFDVGEFEVEHLLLNEADERGLCRRSERFLADRLGDAIVRLYERYAELLPEGPECTRATATARTMAMALGPPDVDSYAAALAPDALLVDRRSLAVAGAVTGRSALAQGLRAFFELTEDARGRVDYILALRAHALLAHWTNSGTLRASGGPFERQFLMLLVFGADGLITRCEWFDSDREEQALARFDELDGEPTTQSFANAATRCFDVFARCWNARDLQGVLALYAPDARLIDRRSLTGTDLEGSDYFENLRVMFAMGVSGYRGTLLATRGDRLALFRWCLEGESADSGPVEVEYIGIVEVDTEGRGILNALFDPADLNAAYAELDACWQAGEATAHPRSAAYDAALQARIAARDWDGVADCYAADLVARDHRLVGWGTLHGPAAFVESMRAMVELSPDVRVRTDHVRMSARGHLVERTWLGTRDGGAFESAFVAVAELDADGKAQRVDFYDPHHYEIALARFDALGAGAPPDPLAALVKPNAATRACDRFEQYFAARDWDALRALYAPTMVFDDRRRLIRTTGDREMFIANCKLVARSGTRLSRTLLGTAGERVALERMLWTGSDHGGAFEAEVLSVIEVDRDDRCVAAVMFDADDRRAAQLEAVDRWLTADPAAAAVIEPALEILRGFNDHDRARIRAVLADEVVMLDHRLSGLETTGADAYVESLAMTWPLVRDVQSDWFPLVQARHGCLGVGSIFGTFEGGPFEVSLMSLLAVTQGRVTRIEIFEPQFMDAALTRFAELRPDPLRIPPNAATQAHARMNRAREARDWNAFSALLVPDLFFDDRRRGVRLTGDRDLLLASSREITTARDTFTLLATAGDRLALQRQVWHQATGNTAFLIEMLTLCEVDAEGRIVAVIVFDADERRAASMEMSERFRRGEGQRMPAAAREGMQALLDHDFERLRSVLPDDFVFHDHRRTGLGRLEGAAAFIESLAPLAEQAPDFCIETLYGVAFGEHGMLDMARVFGTLAASGGAFEMNYARLAIWRGDRLVALELFEPEDLDPARARFEALRLDPAAG